MTRRYISGLLTFAATIFAVGQALALETQPGEPEFGDKVEAPCDQAVPSDEPLAAGRVVAVDRAAGRITLEFGRSRSSCWRAARAFSWVKDPASLKALGPGDKVRFEVERNGRSYVVTARRDSKLKRGGAPLQWRVFVASTKEDRATGVARPSAQTAPMTT